MRDFANVKRIVVKVGTNTLTKCSEGGIDTDYIRDIGGQIAGLLKQ